MYCPYCNMNLKSTEVGDLEVDKEKLERKNEKLQEDIDDLTEYANSLEEKIDGAKGYAKDVQCSLCELFETLK